MFCSKCGGKNDDGARFCSNCGERLSADEPVGEEKKGKVTKGKLSSFLQHAELVTDVLDASLTGGGHTGGLTKAMSGKGRFAKFFSFKGRATRKEFVWISLIAIIIIIAAINTRPRSFHEMEELPLQIFWCVRMVQTILMVLIACWALVAAIARRLHDIGRSGRLLWGLLLLVGVPASCICWIISYRLLPFLWRFMSPVVVGLDVGAYIGILWAIILSAFGVICNGETGTNKYGPDPDPKRRPKGRVSVAVESSLNSVSSIINKTFVTITSDNAPKPFAFIFSKFKCDNIRSRTKVLGAIGALALYLVFCLVTIIQTSIEPLLFQKIVMYFVNEEREFNRNVERNLNKEFGDFSEDDFRNYGSGDITESDIRRWEREEKEMNEEWEKTKKKIRNTPRPDFLK